MGNGGTVSFPAIPVWVLLGASGESFLYFTVARSLEKSLLFAAAYPVALTLRSSLIISQNTGQRFG